MLPWAHLAVFCVEFLLTASVALLGSLALIFNSVLAKFFVGSKFLDMHLIGTILVVGGVVTIVLVYSGPGYNGCMFCPCLSWVLWWSG